MYLYSFFVSLSLFYVMQNGIHRHRHRLASVGIDSMILSCCMWAWHTLKFLPLIQCEQTSYYGHCSRDLTNCKITLTHKVLLMFTSSVAATHSIDRYICVFSLLLNKLSTPTKSMRYWFPKIPLILNWKLVFNIGSIPIKWTLNEN